MQENEASARKEATTKAGVELKQAVDDGNRNLKDAGRSAAATLKVAANMAYKISRMPEQKV